MLPETVKLKLQVLKLKTDVIQGGLDFLSMTLDGFVKEYNALLEEQCKEAGKTLDDIQSYNIETGELKFK